MQYFSNAEKVGDDEPEYATADWMEDIDYITNKITEVCTPTPNVSAV